MDKLNIVSTGFPLTNKTLRFLQAAWTNPLVALAMLSGDKTILYGVTLSLDGLTVSSGSICVDGEILPFEGGAYNASVTILETVENVTYNVDADNNGQLDSLSAYVTRKAKCGTAGVTTFPFADLKRLKTIKELSEWTLPANIVIDPNYVHTDFNFTLALLQKLNGIEAFAETNVPTDWNETSPASDRFLQNKPFTAIKVTKGTMMATQLSSSSNDASDDPNYNRATVYPPSGFNISHLVGFVNSLAYIAYSGNVGGDDKVWCKYQIDTAGGKVIMYGNSKEHSAASHMNYMAIWIK